MTEEGRFLDSRCGLSIVASNSFRTVSLILKVRHYLVVLQGTSLCSNLAVVKVRTRHPMVSDRRPKVVSKERLPHAYLKLSQINDLAFIVEVEGHRTVEHRPFENSICMSDSIRG